MWWLQPVLEGAQWAAIAWVVVHTWEHHKSLYYPRGRD